MIDAVLSYHTNPFRCGVAKFSEQLARRLNVRFGQMAMESAPRHPLLSVKFSELLENGATGCIQLWPAFDLFAHDAPVAGVPAFDRLVTKATTVYAGNGALAADLAKRYNRDVVTAFCPSTLRGDASRGGFRVLAFGMAHKLALSHFRRLKDDLERDHPDYTLSLSTAVHEGSPWDEALTQSTEAMRAIFGPRLRVLGYLADDALAKEIQDCDAVAAFFQPALRANNTSAWAALSAGKFLYTNLDEHSPELNPERYGWDALLQVLA